ncbi:MAG: helix-turn-helix domain-containing protein [Salinibacterium sp.]|nr:helix-turn-helix domain-containing protein [Salinibacterium sp.]
MDPRTPKDSRPELGEIIRERRRQSRLTVEKLASDVGCSKGYLSEIETGRDVRPSDALLRRLETALGFTAGELRACIRLKDTPPSVQRELSHLRARHKDAQRLVELINTLSGPADAASPATALDQAHASGELRRLIDRLAPETQSDTELVALPHEVPLINSVTAGYPADFTDLGYPARVADEYVRCPDINDPDAFAARVVGDSMEPVYQQGDVVVFSPSRPIKSGADCFARLEPDHESTFKRVFFEAGGGGEELIRLQPLNPSYAPSVVPRERVAGLYAAVTVMRRID